MPSSGNKDSQLEPGSIRFGHRVPVNVPVRLKVDGQHRGRGTIRNASMSGAFIETQLDLRTSTDIVVIVTVRDGATPATRELSAYVVRDDPNGFGVEWRSMEVVDILDLLARASSII